jgi:hypothetical protein
MQFSQAPQDRENSTYRWVFHLISNDPDRQLLCGYSKKVGKREAADKQYLLTSTLSRLLGPTNRYLIDKAWQMEIFRRYPVSKGLGEEKIADLYQNSFELFGQANLDLELIGFLKTYYTAVRSGTYEQLLPVPKANIKQQEAADFIFFKDAYANHQELIEHCKDMLHRYSRPRVEAYWLTYCQMHYSEWLNAYQTDAPPYANEAGTPSSEQQATQQAIQKLHAKFGGRTQ